MSSPDDLDATVDEAEDTPPATRRPLRTPLAIPIPRAETPHDGVLADAVARIRAADPRWEIGDAVTSALEQLDAELVAARARIAELEAIIARPRARWQRWASFAGKAIGAGAIASTLWMAAAALVRHGEQNQVARDQASAVRSHGRWIAIFHGALRKLEGSLQLDLLDDNTPKDLP